MKKAIHTAEYEHFLAELRALRSRAGLNQRELGERLGEDQTFVSKCELGVRRVDVIELQRWTTALGSSLTAFARQLEDRLERHAPVRTSPR